jgi:hypothetical protein
MTQFSLNRIVHSESGWTCNVFELDKINVGGLMITSEDYETIEVMPFSDYVYRFYKRSKKIVFSSKIPTEYNYCGLDVKYSMWKCVLCKKLSKANDPNCFCQTYSKCWTPINAIISGVIFSHNCEFEYHFSNNELSNLII